jgi:hypothetical protein
LFLMLTYSSLWYRFAMPWVRRTLDVAFGFCARTSYHSTWYVAFLSGWSAKWWSRKLRFMFRQERRNTRQ